MPAANAVSYLMSNRKGHLQPVLMTMMQRAGNKKVTIVENVELYGIPAHKLAQTAQRIAAASATGTYIHVYVCLIIIALNVVESDFPQN